MSLVLQVATNVLHQKELWFAEPASRHPVHFHPYETSLATTGLEYVGSGLSDGETCVVVATPQTLAELNKGLRARGVDLLSVMASDQYLTYDAEDVAERFMQGRIPARPAFLHVADGVMAVADRRHRPIRVFCELAVVFLQQRNVAAVTGLERYWESFLKRRDDVRLYCAYPEQPL
jgi:hypothetical protein